MHIKYENIKTGDILLLKGKEHRFIIKVNSANVVHPYFERFSHRVTVLHDFLGNVNMDWRYYGKVYNFVISKLNTKNLKVLEVLYNIQLSD